MIGMVESLIKRAKAFIGLEEDDVSPEEISREEINVEAALRPKKGKNSNSSETEIVIHEPKVYEDSLTISTQLRGGSPVIINLRHLDPTEGTRLIDFVCGTAYAIDGHMIKIGESIFLFTPSNIIISDVEERSIEESIIAEEKPLFGRR
jgi:FtsZ-interacting cell division protein YlmF